MVYNGPLVAPVRADASHKRRVIQAVAGGFLGALLLVALLDIARDGSSSQRGASFGQMSVDEAAAMRGTVATDEAEAAAIVPPHMTWEEHMSKDFEQGLEHRGTTDPRKVADSIIDFADIDNNDHTGANSNKLRIYETAERDKTLKRPDLIKGSVPTSRAESDYITSGVVGNYERSLGNTAMARIGANGKAKPFEVADAIIDNAVTAVSDCTGVVDANGQHGIGKGRPPCDDVVIPGGNCPAHSHMRVNTNVPHDERLKCRCDPGYSGPIDGECTVCPPMHYCIGSDTPPAKCPVNSVSGKGQTECQCVAGFLGTPGPEFPPTQCKACPHGRYCDGGMMLEICPLHMTSPEGSKDRTQCACKPGFHAPNPEAPYTCVLCPQDHYCPLGPTAIACPAGATTKGHGKGLASDCNCKPGTFGDGTFCTECPADHYCIGGDEKEACPPLTHSLPRSGMAQDCIENPLHAKGGIAGEVDEVPVGQASPIGVGSGVGAGSGVAAESSAPAIVAAMIPGSGAGSGSGAPMGSGHGAPMGSGSGAPMGSGSGAPMGSGSGAPMGSGHGAPMGSGSGAPMGSGSTSMPHMHGSLSMSHGSGSFSMHHGSHSFSMPHGSHSFSMPHGSHSFSMPHGSHSFSMPHHGSHSFSMPHGSHSFSMPHHGSHSFSMPHYGSHSFSMSHGSHSFSMPHYGSHSFSMPHHGSLSLSHGAPPETPIPGVGDHVSAMWMGDHTCQPGMVTNVNEDGTFGIQFDNGEFVEKEHPQDFCPPFNILGSPMPPGSHSFSMPHGSHSFSMSQGSHSFSMPHHGSHSFSMPHGSHSFSMPHGSHSFSMPHHGSHSFSMPHGSQSFSMPHHGSHSFSMPHGSHSFSMPHHGSLSMSFPMHHGSLSMSHGSGSHSMSHSMSHAHSASMSHSASGPGIAHSGSGP